MKYIFKHKEHEKRQFGTGQSFKYFNLQTSEPITKQSLKKRSKWYDKTKQIEGLD